MLELNLNNNLKIAPFVVVDFSWALINSINEIFNNCSFISYLKITYDIVTSADKKDELRSFIQCRIILCSFHTMKSIIQKLRSMKIKNPLRRDFIFCFTILQNCNTIQEFDLVFKNIFNLFYNKNEDDLVSNSINFLKNEILKRKYKEEDYYVLDSSEYEKKFEASEEFQKKTLIFVKEEDIKDINKNSPFRKYFDNIIDNLKNIINQTNTENSAVSKNSYYAPELLELVIDKLCILPLWTCILASDFKNKDFRAKDIELSHLKSSIRTNNNVENYFGHLKKSILNSNKKAMPSEIIGKMFKRVIAKFSEHYSANTQTSLLEKKTIYNREETWKDKKSKGSINEKGYYFKSKAQAFIETSNKRTEKDEVMDVEDIDSDHMSIISDEENDWAPTKDDEAFLKTKLEQIENSKYDEIASIFCKDSKKFREIIKKLRKVKGYSSYNRHKIDKRYQQILDIHNLTNFKAIFTTGDGNCFYRALSQLLFNSEDKFFILKILGIFIIFEYQEFFTEYIRQFQLADKFKEFIKQTSKRNSWAKQFNITATSIMLNRTILVFSEHNNVGNILKYNLNGSDENPILLCLGFNHFVPVLRTSEDSYSYSSSKGDILVNYRENIIIDLY